MENQNTIMELTANTTMYSSVKVETPEAKALLFNAMNNPAYRIADCINKVIMVKDIFVETVECVNKESGEVSTCPRVVVIDADGVGYVAVSTGIYNAIRKVIAIFGEPTWENPIPLEVKQISKGDRKILTFNVKA